ncbi:T-lymphocyte activation antigen CD80 isoform X2 [Camelus ferus]|uniref:T-lymphocyte activation antigen CD80 n=2 Tax=Camelus TaxID=9836 RepID=A0A8B7KDY8_CAMFR|nr:T-lymphocyte activation antigen CD80 isoform X2 [Camelus bactrianus]XP_014419626.1 T-lymphocyte activation antigen CD80 isoform X2 [Camelus ferus]
MGHTLKRGTPPPKRPSLMLFQLLVLAGLFYFCSGIMQVTKTVKEIAVLSCDYNISTEELTKVRIYWQKDNEVVLAVMSGKVKVWPEYENRTFTDFTSNLCIVILALRLSDKGTYTCVIQKPEQGTYKLEHLTSVKLLVRADFPAPSISDLGNPSPDIRRIICSTSGGFPEPHLSWLENGEELNATYTTLAQDPETELYTISSELDFNVTRNHSFMCLVKYGDLTVSQTFNWQKSKPAPSANQLLPWAIIIPISASLIIALILGLAWLFCRLAARQRERRRNEESLEMERLSPVCIGRVEGSG